MFNGRMQSIKGEAKYWTTNYTDKYTIESISITTATTPEQIQEREKSWMAEQIDRFLHYFFSNCPTFLWGFFMRVSDGYWERVNGCITCHFWRARLIGWLDATFFIAFLGVIYGLIH